MPRTNLSAKAEWRRIIDRVWARHLTTSERACVSFIFTVTLEWNKPADRIKSEHFVYGLGSACGTGLSDKTVRRCLAALETLGVIERKRGPRGYTLALNMDWKPMGLAEPKRKKEPTSGLATPKVIGQNDLSRPVNLTDHYKRRDIPEKEHTLSSSPSARTDGHRVDLEKMTARAAVDMGTAKNKAAKDAAKAGQKITREGLARVWIAGYRDAFPDDIAPLWTERDFGQAKLFLRHMERYPIDPMEVFGFCLRSWSTIIGARFAWMGDPPTTPAVGFMLKFKERFYDAWNERARLSAELTMTADERKMRKLIRQGLTEDEARAEVQGARDIEKQKAKLAQTQDELNARLREADARAVARPAPRLPTTRAQRANPVAPRSDFE